LTTTRSSRRRPLCSAPEGRPPGASQRRRPLRSTSTRRRSRDRTSAARRRAALRRAGGRRRPAPRSALRAGLRAGETAPPAGAAAPPPRARGVPHHRGLGGVAFVLAATLAHAGQARLVLTSRARLPDREDWDAWRRRRGDLDPTSVRIARVQALEGMGAEVELVSADVTDVPACGPLSRGPTNASAASMASSTGRASSGRAPSARSPSSAARSASSSSTQGGGPPCPGRGPRRPRSRLLHADLVSLERPRRLHLRRVRGGQRVHGCVHRLAQPPRRRALALRELGRVAHDRGPRGGPPRPGALRDGPGRGWRRVPPPPRSRRRPQVVVSTETSMPGSASG